MRKYFFLIASLALISSARAEDNSEFSTDAEYRLRYQLNTQPAMVEGTNSATPNTESSFKQRMKLGVNWKKGTAISAHVGLLHNMTWGQSENTDSSIGTHDGLSNENTLVVNEAYANWMVNDSMMVRAGRTPIFAGDGSVMAQNDYEAYPFTFDGAILSYDTDFAKLYLVGVKAAEFEKTPTQAVDDPEENFYGLGMDVKSLPAALKMVHAHIMQVNKSEQVVDSPGTDVAGETTLRYGLTVGGDMSNIDYKATYAANSGKLHSGGTDTDWTGNMMQAEVGYSMPDMMASRFYFAWHMDTGDDATTTKREIYNPFFYERHDNAGLMDVVGWGNLTSYSLGYTLQPKEDIKVGAHYHMFKRTETKGAILLQEGGRFIDNTGGAGAFTAGNDKSAIGNEIDITADKSYNNGLTMSARVGMFMPGDYLKDANLDKSYMQYMLQAKMNF
jgi:hypothetical protein